MQIIILTTEVTLQVSAELLEGLLKPLNSMKAQNAETDTGHNILLLLSGGSKVQHKIRTQHKYNNLDHSWRTARGQWRSSGVAASALVRAGHGEKHPSDKCCLLLIASVWPSHCLCGFQCATFEGSFAHAAKYLVYLWERRKVFSEDKKKLRLGVKKLPDWTNIEQATLLVHGWLL